ncbi:MAG: multidrug transporter [Gammaproteobacteria bacterium]|nr:MAG: multidrug transporter [Gammaproteobacteria bacterium]
MPPHALLNNIVHKDLKIITQRSALYGDDVAGSLIFPEEFTAVQREYPIFFQKDSLTNEFQAIALFGFQDNENLFLNDSGWTANYIPAVIEREPFLIGFQSSSDPEQAPTPMIHIDMNSPRISKTDMGEAVFQQYGGNSAYIDRIGKILMLIHEGIAVSQAMFKTFSSLDLIESFALNITFNNGSEYKSNVYYTINQEKLFSLDDAVVGQLHKAGLLHYAYMVLASTNNIKTLIERKNSSLNKG